MSNECVALMREEADSYKWLEGGLNACLRCGIHSMYSEARFFATSGLDLQSNLPKVVSMFSWSGAEVAVGSLVRAQV